jgi:ketosteroid isomerase-like protein
MPTAAEDRDEILQLMYRYNHAADSGDTEAYADTFTDDGVFDFRGSEVTGRENLKGLMAGVSGTRHVTANPVIEVDGDTATLRAYVLVFRGTTLSRVGDYDDELVRTPAGWRFSRRRFSPEPA